MIDGQRTFIWSGEFHYWRLPSPDLWRDMLQKMKADGYNAVSIYFDWGYHSPKQGSTTSPASATWTSSWTSRRRSGSTSSPAPVRTSTPRWTAAASPAG